jgi:hypothetical protein
MQVQKASKAGLAAMSEQTRLNDMTAYYENNDILSRPFQTFHMNKTYLYKKKRGSGVMPFIFLIS